MTGKTKAPDTIEEPADVQFVEPAEPASDWSPRPVDEKTGHTLIGKYPASGPARAIALSDAGLKSDPDGVVTDATIAAFKGVK